jgi:DNA-binding CsgD family transcriptional regulator
VAEDTQVLQTAAEIMMRCIENRELTKELTDIRINLEKRVRTKTHSLQEANRRLKDEITAHRDSIARLKQREAELADKNKTFMDLTNDLAGLIHHGKGEAGEAEECVLRKLDLLIDPAQARTAATRGAGTPAKYIDHVRGGLKELSSMLKTQSSFVYRCLTPMEIQVANLIKQGRGNKEVADLLNVSRRTVEVHRYNIRKKLQLDKKKMNLKTFLSNLE